MAIPLRRSQLKRIRVDSHWLRSLWCIAVHITFSLLRRALEWSATDLASLLARGPCHCEVAMARGERGPGQPSPSGVMPGRPIRSKSTRGSAQCMGWWFRRSEGERGGEGMSVTATAGWGRVRLRGSSQEVSRSFPPPTDQTADKLHLFPLSLDQHRPQPRQNWMTGMLTTLQPVSYRVDCAEGSFGCLQGGVCTAARSTLSPPRPPI